MKSRSNSAVLWARALTLALFVSSLVFVSARADVAPPEFPPGSNPVPGSLVTQVRMMAERVTLTVISRPPEKVLGQAKTEAAFLMRNLGTAAESLDVRFPLTFFDGRDDGFGHFPEIADLQVLVNGKPVTWRRVQAAYTGADSFNEQTLTPWAAFSVNFPPGIDVPISVTYLADGYGYEPYYALRYVLVTGAGWNGTIGTAEVIVRLPYEANAQNVVLGETTGFSDTTSGAQFVGNEVRWHFEDFEPTSANNIEISLVQTALWRKVQEETANTTKNPADGEAWGRLGKAYKEVVRFPRFFRGDPAGLEMYQLSLQAYEKAVTLLPEDALWHYGFADLLWSHHSIYHYGRDDTSDLPELVRAVEEIRTSLALDPKNQDARDLAGWMASQYPWALSQTDAGFDFLLLTATPTAAPRVITETPAPAATATPVSVRPTVPPAATRVPPPAAATPVSPPAGGLPFCGGAALLLPLLAAGFWGLSRRG
jgi:tetratricopeptide (TPR) repeat protein